MAEQRSAWRANDVVAYDAMREAANSVIALLLRLSDQQILADDVVMAEVDNTRSTTLNVDGYDRTAVDQERSRLDARAAELRSMLP